MKTFLTIILLFNTPIFAEEIKPNLNSPSIIIENQTVVVQDFRDLPYTYAKQLPPELYYWWALAENKRQLDRARSVQSPSMVQFNEEERGWIPTARNNGQYIRSYRSSPRYYYFNRGRPATFYNPFFR